MTAPKQVSFLERVSKSKLGLEGLQKVVYADRARHEEGQIEDQEYNFANLGKKMLTEIDGEYIKKNYINIKPGKEFGQKLHEERIKWLKNQKIYRK